LVHPRAVWGKILDKFTHLPIANRTCPQLYVGGFEMIQMMLALATLIRIDLVLVFVESFYIAKIVSPEFPLRKKRDIIIFRLFH
jgi:hypothetical protein